MNEDDNYDNENMQEDPESLDPPASVVFMEIMRHAAVNRQAVAEVTLVEDGDEQGEDLPVPELTVTDDLPPVVEQPDQELRRVDALHDQRSQRQQRRRVKRTRKITGITGGVFRSFLVVILSGGLIATILSWWTSPESLNDVVRAELGQVYATQVPPAEPTIVPTPRWLTKIGIISGHRGAENDPGAICENEDGEVTLTENEVNFAVAQLVFLELQERGYDAELMDEWDNRLDNYQAAALVSIHANDCQDYGEPVSGYLVAHAEARPEGGLDGLLVDCLAAHYESNTKLERRYGYTADMTDYHAFREILNTTPGAILETGFMLGDRELLTTQPELLARGIVDGILCFVELGGDDPLLNVAPPLPTLTAVPGG